MFPVPAAEDNAWEGVAVGTANGSPGGFAVVASAGDPEVGVGPDDVFFLALLRFPPLEEMVYTTENLLTVSTNEKAASVRRRLCEEHSGVGLFRFRWDEESCEQGIPSVVK